MNGGLNVLYTHFTEELLGLQGIKITNIENSEKSITVYAELERRPHNCTSCGTATSTVVWSERFPLSVTTVIRIFNVVSYPKAKLPQVLFIDEFKGNTGGEKY